jgi:hypothetical protein
MVHVLRPDEIAPTARQESHAKLRARLLAVATAFAAFFVVLAIAPQIPAIVSWLQAHLALSQFWS